MIRHRVMHDRFERSAIKTGVCSMLVKGLLRVFQYSRRLSYMKWRTRGTNKSSRIRKNKSRRSRWMIRSCIAKKFIQFLFPFPSLEFLPILETLRVRAWDTVVTELRHRIDNAFVRFSFRTGIPLLSPCPVLLVPATILWKFYPRYCGRI